MDRGAKTPRSDRGAECTLPLRAIVVLFGLIACGPRLSTPDSAEVVVDPSVASVGYTVRDLDNVAAFFQDVLDFSLVEVSSHDSESEWGGKYPVRSVRLQLGAEQIQLTQYPEPGRSVPEDSTSNDLWFQHLAIVVSDMDRAYQRLLQHGVSFVSVGGPQTIPLSNPAAAGIRAFYFEDPEQHVLELIWYPQDKGDPQWQLRDSLFLGIDHTAIAVSDTDQSVAFYEAIGFAKGGESLNYGAEQSALTGVSGARVKITGLVARSGMGIELLHYVEPGPGRAMPIDTSPRDSWYWEITVASRDSVAVLDRIGSLRVAWDSSLVFDPDRHVLRLIEVRAP